MDADTQRRASIPSLSSLKNLVSNINDINAGNKESILAYIARLQESKNVVKHIDYNSIESEDFASLLDEVTPNGNNINENDLSLLNIKQIKNIKFNTKNNNMPKVTTNSKKGLFFLFVLFAKKAA